MQRIKINRLFTALVMILLSTPIVTYARDYNDTLVRDAFYKLSKSERTQIQKILSWASIRNAYSGKIDGAWGKGTALAFGDALSAVEFMENRPLNMLKNDDIKIIFNYFETGEINSLIMETCDGCYPEAKSRNPSLQHNIETSTPVPNANIEAVNAIFGAANQQCALLNGIKPDRGEYLNKNEQFIDGGTVTNAPITQDGMQATIVLSDFTCKGDGARLWCGARGCSYHIIIEGTAFHGAGLTPQPTDFHGVPALLTTVPSNLCRNSDGITASSMDTCINALTYSQATGLIGQLGAPKLDYIFDW